MKFFFRRAFVVALVLAFSTVASSSAPVRLIYDTDMQTDCDDVAALGVLHALADRGEVEILATMVCVLNSWAAPCTDAINTFYGRPHLPLGQLKGSGVNLNSTYTKGIAENFPQDTGSAAQAADAAIAYRQILANEADQSVVILSVGYMTNLARLMNSPADAISPLTGAQLIQQKVKLWICMGGNFPNDAANGSNVNFRRDPATVIDCVAHWSGPIVFVGREIGHNMRAGARLSQTPASNPVRRAYELFFGGAVRDQHCADIAAVLYAVRGLADYWDMQSTGSVQFTGTDARFNWAATPDLAQEYLLAKMSPTIIQELLEDLMITPPGGQTRPTAAIVAPAAGQRFAENESVSITANAADANGMITKVEFFDGFKKIGERTAPPYAIQWASSSAGDHSLTIKATDDQFGTTISAPIIVRIGQSSEGNGTGLKGEYFDNIDLTNLKLTRIDQTVSFNWGTGAPDPSIGSDSFSVRWTGAVLPAHASGAQSYTFHTRTNDGVRLWVNDTLLIDDWNNGPLREKSGTISLSAGQLYAIRMEFCENTNSAEADLQWESNGIARQIIPRTQLFPETNRAPVAVGDSAVTEQELSVAIAALANDSDPDLAPTPLRLLSAQPGAAGAVAEIVGSQIIYTPPNDFLGTDTVHYVISDGQDIATASVAIEVRPWSTYESFRRKYFSGPESDDPEISGWLADPDGDGICNGIEYAQFGDPTHPDELLVAVSRRDGHLVLTYHRRKAATDLAYIPQVSSTLTSWHSGIESIQEAIVAEDAVQQTIEARDLGLPAGEFRYMRLLLTELM